MTNPSFDESESVNAHDEFHNAYGAAMTAWARLEGCLCYWFIAAAELSEPRGRAIFFSARTFTGKRDMIVAVLQFAQFAPETTELIRVGLKKAGAYSIFRNKAAHGEPVLDIRPHSASWAQFVLVEGKSVEDDPNPITVSNLNAATRKIGELRQLLWDANPMFREPSTDCAECLRLIRALPNHLHTSE